MPMGGPEKRMPMPGTPANHDLSGGCTYCWTSGAKTKRPHMP
jgi:hypothetical protein